MTKKKAKGREPWHDWKGKWARLCKDSKRQHDDDQKLIADLLAKQKPDVQHPAGTVLVTPQDLSAMKQNAIQEVTKQRDRYERDFQMEQERRTAAENQVRVLMDQKVVDDATIEDQKARHDQQVKTLAAVKAGYETRIDSLLKDLDVALADRVRIKQSFTCIPGWTPEAEAKYRGTVELKVSTPDPKLLYCQKIIQAVRVLVQSENEGENNVQA